MRRLEGGGGAAPAGGIRNPALGRPWPVVRRHYDRLPPRGLDAAETKAGGSPPDKGAAKGRPCVPPGSYGAGDLKSPRWSAAGRAPFAKGARASQKARPRWAPCGAPSPRHLAEGNRKAPLQRGRTTANPAPQRTGAMTLGLSRRSESEGGLFDNRIGDATREQHGPCRPRAGGDPVITESAVITGLPAGVYPRASGDRQ